jgi:hypothetical protein
MFVAWKSAPLKSRWNAALDVCRQMSNCLSKKLKRLATDTQGKMASANRDLSNARDEIAMLKAIVEKLSSELAQLKATPNANSKK